MDLYIHIYVQVYVGIADCYMLYINLQAVYCVPYLLVYTL